ncbi:preprotein translocase subunit YajC [Sediminicurvatus halobius]|uniref:Sec translocon accessory complex subunit YajC n=1 Tax=Sediminicurvatus halobius TaxID=2182432 RepID=A0A2U2N488_9GAMM|nr:preprotein translocase subunit YajC [Spiribacter halobius]PWG64045.1 preprotein translocase subunit YajC [Spiribacter halobius]UEX76900.1 preprotein translocase subunit YajC [Spiribacter halobius]
MDFFISEAMAQDGAGGAGLTGLIFPIALIVIFYFLLIRPQQKRAKEHKKLVENLAKGDEVLTSGGVVGRVTEVGDTFAGLEIANGIEVRLQKNAVAQILPKGTLKQKLDKSEDEGKAAEKADKSK